MRIPRLRDYFALSGQAETITEEAHTIPDSSPYVIDLDQLPKVNSSASGVLDNVWISVAATSALVTVSVETSPGTWETFTITDTTPSAGEVYFFLADAVVFPYVPRLQFHSSAAGLNVKVSYTGMGTVPLASYFQTLFDELETLSSSSGGGGGLAFQLSGALEVGDLTEPVLPAQTGTVSGGSLLVLDTGSSGTTIVDIKKCSVADTTGTSILTSPISIIASGVPEIVDVSSSINVAVAGVSASNWLRIVASSVATGAEGLSGRLLL